MYAKPELWLVNDARVVILDVTGEEPLDNVQFEEPIGGEKSGHLVGLD